jgi:hypothetical protein
VILIGVSLLLLKEENKMIFYEHLPGTLHSKVSELEKIKEEISSDDYFDKVKLILNEEELLIYLSFFVEKEVVIQSANHLFFFFTYLSVDKIEKYMDFLSPQWTEVQKEMIQTRFLPFIYIKMIKIYQDWKCGDISHDSFEEEYQAHGVFIQKIYEKGYLRNPLYPKEEEEDTLLISLFDLFVHASFLMEYRELAHLILKEMMKSGRYTKEEYDTLFQSTVNIHALYWLDGLCKDRYHDFLEGLEEELENSHFYLYSFLFLYQL